MGGRLGPVLAAGLLLAAGACSHVPRPLERVVGGDDGPVLCGPGDDCGGHAKVCQHPTVHALACDLDHLQKHIEWYGSVVAKQPDVWGQARLTQYREEFEKEMAGELGNFKVLLQGNVARTDQAFFAQAAALSAAAAPPVLPAQASTTAVITQTDKGTAALSDAVSRTAATTGTIEGGGAKATAGEDRKSSDTRTRDTADGLTRTTTIAPPVVTAPPAADPGSLLGNTGFTQNGVAAPAALPIAYVAQGAGLEPAVLLEQKRRYLNYLQQLRRENEGSDTADAPGYSLNLMRLPVSVLPGSHTDRGHGAEITFTVEPVLGDDLLPATFRTMVTNDLVQSLGFPLTKFLDEERQAPADKRLMTDDYRELLRQQDYLLGQAPAAGAVVRVATGRVFQAQGVTSPPVPRGITLPRALNAFQKTRTGPATIARPAAPPGTPAADAPPVVTTPDGPLDPAVARAGASQDFRQRLVQPRLSFANGIQDRQAFPISQLIDVYGPNFAFEIAYAAQAALRRDIERNRYAHLPDVQGYLREEVRAAHQFLAEPANQRLWQEFCTPDLVALVRSQSWDRLRDRRRQFRDAVTVLTGSKPLTLSPKEVDGRPLLNNGQLVFESNPPAETRQYSLTTALAWGLVVDAALLTDRLVRDMRETATAKNKPVPGGDAWLPYFLPCPPPEARSAFNEYVRVRWPVHVFALDPTVQEQNIGDSLGTRRETQFALAVAFTQGVINANTLTRYARRLEAQYDTVALNRTQVGFAHGENTFGWRFFPRFQTPPTQSNLTVLVRDQLIGGPTPNALLRQRRLEPGPRECVALVLMPAFVPYLTVDSQSNWFRLADPKCKLFDHTAAARLSKAVRTLERCGPGVADADCYRDGELRRLQGRVQQLAGRLPAQTQTAPVPVLNTAGGFELFSNGTTDLAPELYGWYGAPGVSRTDTTTLFLAGDHFSPLRTRVIVGNTEVATEHRHLLSRQVVQVTVPAGTKLLPVTDPREPGRQFVQVFVGTPYGVSRELLVPLVPDPAPTAPAAPAEGYTLKPDAVTVTYGLTPSTAVVGAHRVAEVVEADPAKLVIDWDDATGSVPRAVTVRFVFEYQGKEVPVPACEAVKLAEADNQFVVPGDELKKVATALMLAVQPDGLRPGANPFDTPFVTKRVEVTPVRDDRHAVKTKAATNQLTLTLVGRYAAACPPKEDAKP